MLGGLLNIFANNTLISPRRAKHASVCLLMLHIKERFCRSPSSTGEGKHSLYCADLSLSPYFIPPLPGPRKDSLSLSPSNKLGGLGDHTQSGARILPCCLSSPAPGVFYDRSLSFIFLSPSLCCRATSPLRAARAEAEEMLHAHSSISPSALLRRVCLNVLM